MINDFLRYFQLHLSEIQAIIDRELLMINLCKNVIGKAPFIAAPGLSDNWKVNIHPAPSIL